MTTAQSYIYVPVAQAFQGGILSPAILCTLCNHMSPTCNVLLVMSKKFSEISLTFRYHYKGQVLLVNCNVLYFVKEGLRGV